MTRHPAWHCPHATLYLRWDTQTLAWAIHTPDGHTTHSIPGYPIGRPAVDYRAAIQQANRILGGDQPWIERPPRSGAHHLHAEPDTPCGPQPWVAGEYTG